MARIRIAVDALECRPQLDPYRSDTNGQTYAALWLSPERRACGISQESGAAGVGTPTAEYLGHRLTHACGGEAMYPSTYPDEASARKLLRGRAGQALLRRICDGYSTAWDGHNQVGRLTPDAQAAWDELCGALDGTCQEASYSDAGDWCQYPRDYVRGEMSDEKISSLAERDERGAWNEQRVVVGGLADLYRETRDELRAEAREAGE